MPNGELCSVTGRPFSRPYISWTLIYSMSSHMTFCGFFSYCFGFVLIRFDLLRWRHFFHIFIPPHLNKYWCIRQLFTVRCYLEPSIKNITKFLQKAHSYPIFEVQWIWTAQINHIDYLNLLIFMKNEWKWKSVFKKINQDIQIVWWLGRFFN